LEWLDPVKRMIRGTGAETAFTYSQTLNRSGTSAKLQCLRLCLKQFSALSGPMMVSMIGDVG